MDMDQANEEENTMDFAIPGMDNSSSQVDAKVKGEKLTWIPTMEVILLDLLKEQVLICNKAENGFTRAQWSHIESKFKEKLGMQLDKSAFKNKIKGWRTTYKLVREMLNETGFGWDEAKQMVVADDLVWIEYLKAHKDAKKFWKKAVPYWHDLCIVIGNDMAEGSDQVDFNDVQRDKLGRNEVLDEVLVEDLNDDNDPTCLAKDNLETNKPKASRATNSFARPSIATPSYKKSKKKKLSEAYIFANSLNNLTRAMHNSMGSKKIEENITPRVKEVYEALNEIEDIEQEVRISAYLSIISDKTLTDAFLIMSQSDRACFVKMKYHPSTSK